VGVHAVEGPLPAARKSRDSFRRYCHKGRNEGVAPIQAVHFPLDGWPLSELQRTPAENRRKIIWTIFYAPPPQRPLTGRERKSSSGSDLACVDPKQKKRFLVSRRSSLKLFGWPSAD